MKIVESYQKKSSICIICLRMILFHYEQRYIPDLLFGEEKCTNFIIEYALKTKLFNFKFYWKFKMKFIDTKTRKIHYKDTKGKYKKHSFG